MGTYVPDSENGTCLPETYRPLKLPLTDVGSYRVAAVQNTVAKYMVVSCQNLVAFVGDHLSFVLGNVYQS